LINRQWLAAEQRLETLLAIAAEIDNRPSMPDLPDELL